MNNINFSELVKKFEEIEKDVDKNLKGVGLWVKEHHEKSIDSKLQKSSNKVIDEYRNELYSYRQIHEKLKIKQDFSVLFKEIDKPSEFSKKGHVKMSETQDLLKKAKNDVRKAIDFFKGIIAEEKEGEKKIHDEKIKFNTQVENIRNWTTSSEDSEHHATETIRINEDKPSGYGTSQEDI